MINKELKILGIGDWGLGPIPNPQFTTFIYFFIYYNDIAFKLKFYYFIN